MFTPLPDAAEPHRAPASYADLEAQDPSHVCPITCVRLKETAVAPDGETFERGAVRAWTQQGGAPPGPRTPLVWPWPPNRALDEQLRETTRRGAPAARRGDVPPVPNTPAGAAAERAAGDGAWPWGGGT